MPTGRLGSLEWRILEAFWARAEPGTVRDIAPVFPESAYTTLMTTTDRLFQKGLLLRVKRGRAFLYWPAISKDTWNGRLCADSLRWALAQSPTGDAVMLLSMLLDAFAAHDPALLDTLEALILERRPS